MKAAGKLQKGNCFTGLHNSNSDCHVRTSVGLTQPVESTHLAAKCLFSVFRLHVHLFAFIF